MDRNSAIATLRAHEPELREAGVMSLALFGSVARGDAQAGSDVDVVARLSEEAASGGFAWFGRIDALTRRLQEILGCPIDVVAEPVYASRLRASIEKDATRAF